MNFFNRLTVAGKAVIILAVVAIIGCALYFSGATKSLGSMDFGSSSGKTDATLVVNTYCGFEPIVWANGGLNGSDDSYFAKNYDLKLKILIMDDFDACRASLKEGSSQMAYCTLDALPVEMSSSGTMTDMRYFMLLNFSAGADVIVADGTVNSVADLKGKSVAYAEGTASHTLLLNVLETSGLTMNDITPVKVSSGIEAAQAFKSKQVSAACVWAPDDEDCVSAFKDAHVLTSTAQANNLVSDGLIAKKEWLDKNQDLAAKVVEAILWANSQIQNDPAAFKEGATVFANAFETDVDFALTSSKKINYATVQDEINWMGLNSDYSGMTGERVYTKMSRAYTSLGLTKSVMPWQKVAYTEIIEKVAASNKLDNKQIAVGTAVKEFSAPTEKLEQAVAISNKKIVINFPVGGYSLDNVARSTIDKEFVDISQSFANARIRVSGNTTNTGNYDSNVALSKKRAQAVVDYLVSEYHLPKNKFVVVGNGPKKAVADGIRGENDAYRTTDLEILAD